LGGLRRVGRSFVSWAFDGTKEHRWLEIRDALADPGRPRVTWYGHEGSARRSSIR